MASPASASSHRLELTLRKPWLGWFPKPTIEVDGRGQPAQWGTGTWQVRADESGVLRVFLFNRLWRFGGAEFAFGTEPPTALVYTAPWLPFLRGRLEAR